ncbi:MAG TPA: acylphosphatase [Steroidobacteraceae bacterium]|nr:acylphosphatase [Steroidobacteraceae bacterium]
MSAARIAKRCLVSGRVQGVYYRASTQHEARRLGVEGYAKNLSDGRVEVLIVGEPDAVSALTTWLWQGSPPSRVTGVSIEDVEVGQADVGCISGFVTA